MQNTPNNPEKQLEFPLTWYSSLITTAVTGDISDLVLDIFTSLNLRNAQIARGAMSAGGKYQSWKISAEVPDLNTFRQLTRALEDIPGKKILI